METSTPPPPPTIKISNSFEEHQNPIAEGDNVMKLHFSEII